MRFQSRRARLALAVLAASLPLTFAVGSAQAHQGGGWPGFGSDQRVVVAGTIVSVNPASNSFVANAYIAGEPRGSEPPPYTDPLGGSPGGAQGGSGPGDGQGGSGGYGGGYGDHHRGGGDQTTPTGTDSTQPTTTQVTITTDPSNTKFRVNSKDGSISDLAAGDKFMAVFNGDSSEDITTLVQNNPPIGVLAITPPKPNQLYAFVGTVTAVNTTNGTVTVNVTNSLPAGLVPAASNPATFTIGGDTLILGGTSTSGLSWGSLSNVAVGDVVAGGLTAPQGETLTQVESTQLRLLLDFPVASATHAVKAKTKADALAKAKSLLGFKSTPKKHKPKKHKGKGKKK